MWVFSFKENCRYNVSVSYDATESQVMNFETDNVFVFRMIYVHVLCTVSATDGTETGNTVPAREFD